MKFPVLIPNIFDHPFTYTSDINLKVGDYVEVPFGKKKVNGIVWNEFEQDKSKIFKLKFLKIINDIFFSVIGFFHILILVFFVELFISNFISTIYLILFAAIVPIKFIINF